MTTTADTPLQLAAKAIKLAFQFKQFGRQLPNGDWVTTRKDIEEFGATAETATRAALVAALQVRWEGKVAFIGIIDVASIVGPWREYKGHFRGWLNTKEGGSEVGWFSTIAEAKSAVQRAVIEAILGASL